MTAPNASNFLVFADKMFAPSESFIHRAYTSFSRLNPIYIGHEIRGPAPDGVEYIKLRDYHGWAGETGFKQFGIVSKKLLKRLEQEEPKLIHAHFGKSGAYALPLAKALNIPLVVTYHGGDATKHANTKNSFLRVYNRRRQNVWDNAALILPCSEFIGRELEAKGCPTSKMQVHRNTADPNRFYPGEKENILLFAGRWIEKKGIDTLIKALARVTPQLEGWTIRLLGEGPLKEQLVQMLHDAGINAQLPGWIPADDMPKEFARTSIVCIPSKRATSGDAEGLPMVCIEAQLAACSVLATRHAGIPECIIDGETGFLVDEDDHVALAEKLSILLAAPEQTIKMGRAGQLHAKTNFDLNIQSKALEEKLLNLI
ncbi:glycosyltransferase [Hirschia litorea]|uniref:Glycosyltransferase n=1 Tax=Hirschia litorea TaxID=1199156 RepID=A0ABW2INE6_9PROT